MMENNTINLNEKTKLYSYKTVCAKLGFIMCIYFICRIISELIEKFVSGFILEIGYTAVYITNNIISIMLAYMIPMLITAILFKSFDYYSGRFFELYKKPQKLAKALGNFPAMYGLGQSVNMLTLSVFYLITKIGGEKVSLEDSYKTISSITPKNMVCAAVMVFVVVVIAPVFEELWVRGMIYDALKPFGDGIAIIVSAILFGLMHSSLQMLFYTTALGFALGYIRYATGSIYVTTILHMIFNSISAGLMFLTALSDSFNEENTFVNSIYTVYLLMIMVLMVVGIIVFIKKIPVIRKYRIVSAWEEISGGKKMTLFLISAPVLLMLVFAVNAHAGNLLINEIFNMVGRTP